MSDQLNPKKVEFFDCSRDCRAAQFRLWLSMERVHKGSAANSQGVPQVAPLRVCPNDLSLIYDFISEIRIEAERKSERRARATAVEFMPLDCATEALVKRTNRFARAQSVSFGTCASVHAELHYEHRFKHEPAN